MKLRAIEAVRYGALENGCLTGLGDGLTVVLGPNESGKSTFTALARHVLYGFPDARKKERGYMPASGGRHARLVFEDGQGQWAVERVEGPHRGQVSVVARSGEARPGLVDELLGGVSEQTYQVVFGFGLDELAQIEHADAADSIVGRLYAAGSGLAVNPLDVRKSLDSRAGVLYAPRAQKPKLNMLAARMRELRDEITELETQAANFASDQLRLRDLTEQLEPLRRERDECEVRLRAIDRDAVRAAEATKQLRALSARRSDLEARRSDLSASLEFVRVDPAVVAALPALKDVLEETSGFRQRLTAITEAEGLAAESHRRAAAMSEVPDVVLPVAQLRVAVERWRDTLTDSRRNAADAERAAVERETLAAQTEVAAGEQSTPRRAPAPALIPGIALIALGAIGAIAGALLGQWIAAALGAFVVVAGVVLVVWRPASTLASTLPDEIVRLRAEAASRRQLADQAQAEYVQTASRWSAWLTDNGLAGAGDDPVAALEVLAQVEAREAHRIEAQRFTDMARREQALAEQWVVRLVDALSAADPATGGQMPTLNGALDAAARARALVERTGEAQAERLDLERNLESARSELRSADEQAATAQAELAQVAERHGVDVLDMVTALDSLAGSQRVRLDELRLSVEGLAQQTAELSGELGNAGRDDAMARARQQLEGLRAEAQSAADEYVTLALAVRLLDATRERYERERQPVVVRNAARVFSAMTAGRYTDVRAPLDGSGITVLGADGSTLATSKLSRGTAEQLYLSLRVGLIGSLGEQGRWLPVFMDDVVVNFDPKRREGAIAAVSELAAARQVLFFTCHPETADALATQVSGARLVSLDRCAM